MVSASPEAPSVIPAEWPVGRIAGARTKHNGTGVRSIYNRTPVPLRWSKEFLEAGKKRLAGDTARAATSDEVRDLRREAGALKEVVAELTLENRLLKKSVTADGEDVT